MADRLRTAIALLLAAAALAACAARPAAPGSTSGAAARRVEAGQPFVVAAGDRRELASPSVTIEFLAVESDSRCARDVTCIWSGDAAVVLAVAAGPDRQTVRLHTNLEPKKAAAFGVVLELVDLSPYPVSTQEIAAADYRATLLARRADS